MQRVDVVARGGVAEDYLPALAIGADARFPRTHGEIPPGPGLGELRAPRSTGTE